ncbi:Cobalt-zinc-cadmium resistance protein CzcA [Neolewinella maritima]|uniref:Cobalt-zinc-cadmium resistance protein CzcA n=1 Tax=Neolewinella maritima TaxID=1383882 RepID=A0ABN8FDS1_9BACT|nr:efflux RND transporter permease subunit [Neolewinella maritima]CAH1002562.1 Cobalt-zinc-cadmium resistance protein CzcA [Neolewinella maritima]
MIDYVKYRNPITALLAIVLLAGVYSYGKMKSDLFPDVTFPKVKIIAENGQQPVDKMMLTVTRPLEEAVKRAPGIQDVRSTTSRGSAEISAFFDWSTDIDLGLQRVESLINQITLDLPPGVRLTIEKMNPSILPIAGYSLEGPLSQIELKDVALYTVKPFLSQVPGVSEVSVSGGKTKEYHLILRPQRMSELGITPQLVDSVLRQANFVTSNGYLQDYDRLYLTLTDAVINDLYDLKQTVIFASAMRTVWVEDIADVVITSQKEYVKIKANGLDVPLVAVTKQVNANLIQVADSLETKVAALNDLLPRGVVLRPYYRQADFVRDSVRGIEDVLWIGLGLAILVAIIFLRSLRSSAVLLITIPLTLSLTIAVLYLLGYDFNIMTLGAIAAAIGLVIDDAIIIVEQLHRSHEEEPDKPASELVSKTIDYLFPAMVGSSLSTIVIFIPFVLMTGIAGAYFRILTETMIITLVCSFTITWIGLPVVYLLLNARRTGKAGAHAETVAEKHWVRTVIGYPAFSIVAVVSLGVVIYLVAPRLPSGFLPELDEGSIVLDYNSPPGTSLEATDLMLRQVDRILDSIPTVVSYSRRTGTQMGFFITEPNRGDYLIQLSKDRKLSTDEVSNQIRQRVEAILPALTVDFGQVITDMLGDLMTSVQPIEIKIFGSEQRVLDELSRRVAGVVESVRGTADVFDGIQIAGPLVTVDPDIALLEQYGLSAADFQFQLQTQLEGTLEGGIPELNQMTPIRMIYPNSSRTTVSDLRGATLFTPRGRLLPLERFGTVTVEAGTAEINRENLKSMGVVSARLTGRDLGSTLADIRAGIAREVALPPGYTIEYGGEYAQQKQAFSELLQILVLAALLVFTVILFLFKRFGVALLIVLLAVLGAAGSLAALYLTGTSLNVGSYVGIIMVIGIIGENSIFTYFQYAENRLTEGRDEAIAYAISTRMRPKLMTAIGAIMALLPLALALGTGAQMHQPLAIAVIGGLVVALPLLLLVLPSLLRLIEK